MDKLRKKTRDIQFYSKKNEGMITVHDRYARKYASFLESQPEIVRYEVGVLLEQRNYIHVFPVDIRKTYFQTQWASDFCLYFSDGRYAIRELVCPSDLERLAEIEKLEFSRRYWAAKGLTDWMVVVVPDDKRN